LEDRSSSFCPGDSGIDTSNCAFLLFFDNGSFGDHRPDAYSLIPPESLLPIGASVDKPSFVFAITSLFSWLHYDILLAYQMITLKKSLVNIFLQGFPHSSFILPTAKLLPIFWD
jgi:hypothetical protein